jgi:hypothetical protein
VKQYLARASRDTAYAALDALIAHRAHGPLPSAVLKAAIDQKGWSGDQTWPSADSQYLRLGIKYLRNSGVPIVATRSGPRSTYAIEEVTAGAHVANSERYERDFFSAAVSFYRSLHGARGRGKQRLRDRIYQSVLAVGLDLGLSQTEVDSELKGRITDPQLVRILDRYAS